MVKIYPYLSSDMDESDLTDVVWSMIEGVQQKLKARGLKDHPAIEQIVGDAWDGPVYDAAAEFVAKINRVIAGEVLARIELSAPYDAYFRAAEFTSFNNDHSDIPEPYDEYVFIVQDREQARLLAENAGVARQLSELTGLPCVVLYELRKMRGDVSPLEDVFQDVSQA